MDKGLECGNIAMLIAGNLLQRFPPRIICPVQEWRARLLCQAALEKQQRLLTQQAAILSTVGITQH